LVNVSEAGIDFLLFVLDIGVAFSSTTPFVGVYDGPILLHPFTTKTTPPNLKLKSVEILVLLSCLAYHLAPSGDPV
jgi:hypothetical protein